MKSFFEQAMEINQAQLNKTLRLAQTLLDNAQRVSSMQIEFARSVTDLQLDRYKQTLEAKTWPSSFMSWDAANMALTLKPSVIETNIVTTQKEVVSAVELVLAPISEETPDVLIQTEPKVETLAHQESLVLETEAAPMLVQNTAPAKKASPSTRRAATVKPTAKVAPVKVEDAQVLAVNVAEVKVEETKVEEAKVEEAKIVEPKVQATTSTAKPTAQALNDNMLATLQKASQTAQASRSRSTTRNNSRTRKA